MLLVQHGEWPLGVTVNWGGLVRAGSALAHEMS
jgi:hypothetical protein